MSASARANTQELTAFDPRRKSRATVCAFTRHPTAVATAVGYLMTLHLPGWVHKVAEILITHCDRQGVYWGKTTGELHRLTGVSPKRIQVAGRELRRLGLVEWKWIKHGRRYPRRTSYHEPVRLGAGDRAGYGGRVWVLQWEKFGVRWPSRKVGKDVAVSDPVGSLMSDPRGSLLRFLSSLLWRDLQSIPHSPSGRVPRDGCAVLDDPRVARTPRDPRARARGQRDPSFRPRFQGFAPRPRP